MRVRALCTGCACIQQWLPSKAERAALPTDKQQRLRQLEHKDQDERAQLPGFIAKLLEGYEVRVWWFEIFECLRKLAVACVPVFFQPSGSAAQLMFGLMVCFSCFGAYVGFDPFEDRGSDVVAKMCQVQIFFSLLSSVALQPTANPGANLDVLLVVIWCVPVCLALVLNSILLKALLKALDRWRAKAEAASEATSEGAAPAASEDVPAATASCSSESDHHPPRDAEAMEMMRMPSSSADALEPEAGADERRVGSSAGTPNPWIN